MIRTTFVIGLLFNSVITSMAAAQGSNQAPVSLQSGFSAQTRQVTAVGEHNVADSATLRARGCVGFVATDPALAVNYDAKNTNKAITIRAESPTDLVMLIGTAANAWFCADDSVGTHPEITLPEGSGTFSVWVGTREKGRAQATVSIREGAASSSTATASTSQTPATASPSGPCGSSDARIPQSIAPDDWSRFTCTTQQDADNRWNQCYGRAAYSDARADGCPGAELCCPYDGFDLATSQAKNRSQSQPATTSASTTSATTTATPATTTTTSSATSGSSTPTFTAAAPVGNVAQGAEDLLTVVGTPFGTRPHATGVYWRGFPNAEVPVRRETRSDAPVLYHLRGSDFPRLATDSLVVIRTPRKLRAKTSTSLNTDDGALQIAAGQEVELLGRTSSTQCMLRIRQQTHTTACPSDAVFEGVGNVFSGLSPLAYQWWIAVENDNRQRGWIHIDLSRPEFVIVLPPEQ